VRCSLILSWSKFVEEDGTSGRWRGAGPQRKAARESGRRWHGIGRWRRGVGWQLFRPSGGRRVERERGEGHGTAQAGNISIFFGAT
jgi:hypothetical protein